MRRRQQEEEVEEFHQQDNSLRSQHGLMQMHVLKKRRTLAPDNSQSINREEVLQMQSLYSRMGEDTTGEEEGEDELPLF